MKENEKSRDIIIDQRFHRTIIGAKGEKIKEIRDKFNQVQITFPDPGKKSDVVTLRGMKTEVDKCYKYLTQLNQELVSPLSQQFEVYYNFLACQCSKKNFVVYQAAQHFQGECLRLECIVCASFNWREFLHGNQTECTFFVGVYEFSSFCISCSPPWQ